MYQLHHISLKTSHFDETIKFYKDVFQCYPRGFFKLHGKDACMMYLNETTILEIFEVDENYPEGSFAHIAIACKDTRALYEHALNCGATPQEAPKEVVLGLEKPIHACVAFVQGKGGEIIELFEEKDA